MNSCPICGISSDLLLADRCKVPILQNRVWPDAQSAQSAPAGRLKMMFCNICHFAWNAEFDPIGDIYDDAYDNDQMQSKRFRTHASQMLHRILKALPEDRQSHLVEVGCGQGAFLSQLVLEGTERIAKATGFDPALKKESGSGLIDLKKNYFTGETSGSLENAAEIVISRHTIEHVPDPLAFLKNIRACMSISPSSRLLLETPDIHWIIDNRQEQDLFYEHCSIFSQHGLRVALELAGFDQIEVSLVFGGQYLWATASPCDITSTFPQHKSLPDYSEKVAQFATCSASFTESWRKTIAEHALTGEVWLWGAASKGVTFAILVDPDRDFLSGAIDINLNKTGGFMPITALQICSPDHLPDNSTVIVMNPNYFEEVKAQINYLGHHSRLLTL